MTKKTCLGSSGSEGTIMKKRAVVMGCKYPRIVDSIDVSNDRVPVTTIMNDSACVGTFNCKEKEAHTVEEDGGNKQVYGRMFVRSLDMANLSTHARAKFFFVLLLFLVCRHKSTILMEVLQAIFQQ